MVWRALLAFGLLLGGAFGTIAATRQSDLPLTSSLLVLRDNRLYRVSMAGNRVLLFEPDEGRIIDVDLSVDNRAVFVVVGAQVHTEVYRVDYKQPQQRKKFVLDDSVWQITYSPDKRSIAYVIPAPGQSILVVYQLFGEKIVEFRLAYNNYSLNWNDNNSITLRNFNAHEQSLVDVNAHRVWSVPYQTAPESYAKSPDGRWEITGEEVDASQYGMERAFGWFLKDNATHTKSLILVNKSRFHTDVLWSKDSQWFALFLEGTSSGRNIFICDVKSKSLTRLTDTDTFQDNVNYFVGGFADRTPHWANWSYDNEWILYSVTTGTITNPQNKIFFSVIHRDGKAHLQNLIDDHVSPETPFWAQWLPPDKLQEINWLFQLSVIMVTLVTGYRMRRLRLNIERKGLLS